MIKVKLLAYNNAPDSIFIQGKKKLAELFPDQHFEYYAPDPDVLVFLSGGSEMEVSRFVEANKFYLLIAFEENNSYAAASEVKAWMDQQNIPSLLTDLYETSEIKIIKKNLEIRAALSTLPGKTIGLIGEVSDWLIASTIQEDVLKSKFGIKLKKIPWTEVPSHKLQSPNPEFIDKYHYTNKPAIEQASQVHEALQKLIEQEKLDGFTIECFSLVQKDKVTACLSLSQFNDMDIPAGCEGDLCSIVGMIFTRALVCKIPWMANLTKVSSDCVRFAHCTAPTALLDHFEVDTHFETGLGTAVAGKFTKGNITVFRLDNSLSKAFVSEGQVLSTHKSDFACRTQIELCIPKDDAAILKHHPLGNHHLIVPGSFAEKLKTACEICGIEVVNSTS